MWNRFHFNQGCRPNIFVRCYLKLCGNTWFIFAGATFALFLYALARPGFWLMLILFAQVCGLFLWRRI